MDRGKEARASRSKRGQKEDEMRLRTEAAEVLDLQRNGDLDMALDRAMSLFNASPCPMIYNLVGDLNMKAFHSRAAKGSPEMSLWIATDMYGSAAKAVPDCIETTTAHGESLSASKEYIDVERVLSIAKSSGIAYAVHRAAAVATTFPKSARAQFLPAYVALDLAKSIEPDADKEEVLQCALKIMDSAAKISDHSLVIALFRAGLMAVLHDYAAAEDECCRALAIEKADDPSSHDIPVGSTKGDEYDDRICFVKKQIHGLLQTLVLFARRDWSLITSEKQRMILSVRLDVLCEYYSKINRSLSKSLTDAHHFEVADAAELQREKRKEGNDIIKAVKKKLRNLPSDRSSNEFHVACKIIQEMCHKLLKSSCTDYREFVLPLLRFHRWLSYSDNLIAGEDKRSEVLVENANPSDLELIDVEDNGVKPSATLETKGTSNYQNSVQDVPKILVPKISDPSLYKPPPDPRIVNQQATRYGYSALHRPAIGQSVVTPVNRLVEIVDAANKFDPYEVEHSHQSYRREQAKIPKDQELCVICFFERYSTIAMASGKVSYVIF
uniref:Uncharacterized protein n=1 Tax=Oryza glumipatula TaxID=40148 RepID=A0A0E0BKJ6_9ORYZ